MARRAKDSERLYEAIEAKLTEQRKFVRWWDGQEKAAGARQPGTNRGTTPLQTGNGVRAEDLGVDRVTLHRWRTRLADDAKFAAALDTAKERCRRVCGAEKGTTTLRGATGTGENEWYTPPEYLATAIGGPASLSPGQSEALPRLAAPRAGDTSGENPYPGAPPSLPPV